MIFLLILMVGRFVTQTYSRMLTNSNSAEGDQGAYLQLGLDLLVGLRLAAQRSGV